MRDRQHAPASGSDGGSVAAALRCAARRRLSSAGAHAGAQPTARALNEGNAAALRLSRTVAGKWRAVKMLFTAVAEGPAHAPSAAGGPVAHASGAYSTRPRRRTCYNTTGSVTFSPP
jgi:hypothetical protein